MQNVSNGNVEAMEVEAMAYLDGVIVPQNIDTAILKFEKTTQLNSHLSMLFLGRIFMQDVVSVADSLLPKDDEKANVWLKRASAHPSHCSYCWENQWDTTLFWKL